jgi:hypothetical protein
MEPLTLSPEHQEADMCPRLTCEAQASSFSWTCVCPLSCPLAHLLSQDSENATSQ